jgi:hypothetical protein
MLKNSRHSLLSAGPGQHRRRQATSHTPRHARGSGRRDLNAPYVRACAGNPIFGFGAPWPPAR